MCSSDLTLSLTGIGIEISIPPRHVVSNLHKQHFLVSQGTYRHVDFRRIDVNEGPSIEQLFEDKRRGWIALQEVAINDRAHYEYLQNRLLRNCEGYPYDHECDVRRSRVKESFDLPRNMWEEKERELKQKEGERVRKK